jgi:hypothetical protein
MQFVLVFLFSVFGFWFLVFGFFVFGFVFSFYAQPFSFAQFGGPAQNNYTILKNMVLYNLLQIFSFYKRVLLPQRSSGCVIYHSDTSMMPQP